MQVSYANLSNLIRQAKLLGIYPATINNGRCYLMQGERAYWVNPGESTGVWWRLSLPNIRLDVIPWDRFVADRIIPKCTDTCIRKLPCKEIEDAIVELSN